MPDREDLDSAPGAPSVECFDSMCLTGMESSPVTVEASVEPVVSHVVPMSRAVMGEVRDVARRRGVSTGALMSQWVREGLEREGRSPEGPDVPL